MKESSRQDPLFINSLEKGLIVLKAFTESSPEMTLGELSQETGITKSSAQRFCHTLTILGLLKKNEKTKRYRPTLKYLDFASCYLSSDHLVRLANSKLIELSRRFNITVNLAQLDGNDIVYSIRVPNSKAPHATTLLGSRRPAILTTGGRIILSYKTDDEINQIIDEWDGVNPMFLSQKVISDRSEILEEIRKARRQGYCFSEQRGGNHSLINVSVPILDGRGQPIAAVHSSLLTSEWNQEKAIKELLPHLIETANSI